MARTPTEHIRELQLEVRALQERDEYRDRDFQRLLQESEEIRRHLEELHRENVALKQQVQDHIARYQEWDRRRWAFILLLMGTVLTLSSGLIVALAKK